MIFTDITYANFFSVTDEIHLQLDNQGLVLIVGENHDSSAADSNGSGKSTFMEALVWCLWGKTVRGETADAVINCNIKKDCYVYVTMRDAGQLYTVRRFRNHHLYKNSLQLWRGTTDLTEGTSTLTQAAVEALLGIDFESFIRGPMMPQGSFKRFSMMTDSEQKVIMENAVQLNLLPVILDKVKEKLNEANLEQQAALLQLTQARGQWSRENEDLERLYEEKKQLRYQVVRQKAEQLSNILWAVVDWDWAWDHWQVPTDCATQADALAKVTTLEQQLVAKWDQNIEICSTDEREKDVELKMLRGAIIKAEADANAYAKLDSNSTCPVCYQEISKRDSERCTVAFEEKIRELKTCMLVVEKAYNFSLDTLQAMRRRRQESMSRALAMRQQAEHDLRVASENHKFNTDMAEVMQRADINLANRVSKIKEPAPLDNIIEDKTNKANILSGTISNLIDKEKEINTKIAHINFWRIGFSNAGIKSKILNSITPFLNKQADIYIRDLTDSELTVIFSTQTQLKNGQTKEQFSVEVKNKNGASTYDGSSGGEKARADLAITLTLSDLYASRSKKSYPQRWFDEPFEALDEAGIEAVMDLLANMVSSCGSIFVITHQGAMKSLFNRTISFEKRNGETRLVA